MIGSIAQTFTLPGVFAQSLGYDADGIPFNKTTSNDDNSLAVRDACFVTSVDIFFDYVDLNSNQNYVRVELRDTRPDGTPGSVVVGYASKFLTDSDGSAIGRATATTVSNFRFNSPVYLSASKIYSLVVKTRSPLTSIYVSELGKTDITSGKGGLINRPPVIGQAGGTLYTSDNGFTYIPIPTKDMKFRLYKAKFDTTTNEINLRSKLSKLAVNIGKLNDGIPLRTFNHSPYVLVKHINHGMYGANQKVVISGVVGSNGTSLLGGIPIDQLNTQKDAAAEGFVKSHDVLYPFQNGYFIKVTQNASSNEDGGGLNVLATSNLQYSNLYSNLNAVNNEFTRIDTKIKTTSGTTLDNNIINKLKVLDTTHTDYRNTGTKDDNFNHIEPDKNIYFNKPKSILSSVNSISSTLDMNIIMNTASENFSPVIPIESNEFNIVNRVKLLRNKVGQSPDDSDLDNNYLSFQNSRANDSDLLGEGDSDDVNKQEKVASYYSSLYASKVDHSDYVTKLVSLETPADTIIIKFSADMNPSNEIDISFKVKRLGDTKNINDQDFENFKLNQFINETNFGQFNSSENFKEYTAEHKVGEDFTDFIVRIRMKTKNESYVPRIKNLRIIAVA